MPTVSVVIPVFNEEAHLATCLESLMQQTKKPQEIIIVDNNSTDASSEIAKRFPVKIIKEQQQGITFARDAGFNAAFYDIIARTDADTIVPKDWIEKIASAFTKDPQLVALTGPAHFYDMTNFLQLHEWQTNLMFRFIEYSMKCPGLYGLNLAIKKSVWEKIKSDVCIDEKNIHEDTDLGYHMAKYGKVVVDSHLVVSTSGRRYKKPLNYYLYAQKLLNTFKKHQYQQ